MSVKAHMLTNFTILPISLTPASAAARLPQGGFGVVVAQPQEPVALVTTGVLEGVTKLGHASLRSAVETLPRVVVAGSRIEMDLLARGVVRILEAGAKATIILGQTGVVGVVPVEGTIKFMRQHASQYQSALNTINSMGGPGVGSIVLASDYSSWGAGKSTAGGDLEGEIPPMPPNCMFCATCEFLNCLPFYPLKGFEPQCQNPAPPDHQLKLAR